MGPTSTPDCSTPLLYSMFSLTFKFFQNAPTRSRTWMSKGPRSLVFLLLYENYDYSSRVHFRYAMEACPYQDLNLGHFDRNEAFCPLNYKGNIPNFIKIKNLLYSFPDKSYQNIQCGSEACQSRNQNKKPCYRINYIKSKNN
jgi:hypothetical protein